MRLGNFPPHPDHRLADADTNRVVNVELPTLGGHGPPGPDSPESMGFARMPGNSMFTNLEPEVRARTDHLFAAPAAGGKVEMPLRQIVRDGYFGSLVDRLAGRWMFDCASRTSAPGL